MAVATHEILNHARAEAGKALKIQDVYNPIRRAENLQGLKDYIESKRPVKTQAGATGIAAGNLPMGKNTVLKDGEWLDVSYDEETGKIVLKDGRTFSVAPGEKIEVEQVQVSEETAPKAAAPVAPEGPVLPIAETPAPVKAETPKSPSGPLSPEMARRLEQIRVENPEEAARIEKGNVAVGIQQYELARMGKAKQMRQGEMFPAPKAQEEIFPATIGEDLRPTKLTQDWKNALKENITGHAWLSFVAENSPDESQRFLSKALLENDSIRKQLGALSVTTFRNYFVTDQGKALGSTLRSSHQFDKIFRNEL